MDLNKLQQAAKTGDRQAEKLLFEILGVRFHLLAYQRVWDKADAEEVAQEALATVAREYKDVEVTASFAAWAQRVLDNRLLSYIRSKRTRGKHWVDDTKSIENTHSHSADPDLKRRLLECLQEVATANRRYARVLNLHYQGFSTSEICSRLGITTANCYVLLSRARVGIEQCLNRKGPKR